GTTPAASFGPLALRAVREEMVQRGWCRVHVNQQVCRLRRAFRWAAEHELIPPAIHHGLTAVSGLKHGRSEARESEPVKPVAEQWVEETMRWASPQIRVMIQFQLLTGA